MTKEFKHEQQTKGWPGSRFELKTSIISAKRIDGRAIIEVEIAEVKSGRLYQHHASITLTREEALEMASSLMNDLVVS